MDGVTDQAVIDAAKRFAGGDVEGQSMTFAPSGPQFIQEARKRQEMQESISRPHLEQRTVFVSHDIKARMEAVRAKHAGRRKLMDCTSLDQFRRLSAERSIPEGATYVWQLDAIFAPEKHA